MKLLKIKKLFKSWYTTYSATYELENGKEYDHDVISNNDHLTIDTLGKTGPDAVILLCKRDRDDTILTIKEFRMPVNNAIYDLPAGSIDEGETAIEAGLRELTEETGYIDIRVDDVLPPSFSSPGLTDQSLTTVFCTILTDKKIETNTEETESIKCTWSTREDVKEILKSDLIAGRAQLLMYNWLNS